MELKDIILEEFLNTEPRVYLNSTDEDFIRSQLKNGLMCDIRRSNLEDLSIACMELLYKDGFADEHKDLLNRVIILGYSEDEVKSYVYKYCKYEVSLELIITVCREIIGDFRWAITSSYLESYEILDHLAKGKFNLVKLLNINNKLDIPCVLKDYPRINGIEVYETLSYTYRFRDIFNAMVKDCMDKYSTGPSITQTTGFFK